MASFRTFSPCPLLSPVPVVLVSCQGTAPGAKPNLLTVAWAGTVNSNPPMVSISVRKERYSYAMLKESGEFVINLVDDAHCRALDYCGVKSGRDVDKWAETGLTPIPADGLTLAPAVAESPAYLSCRVKQVIPLGSHDLFLAEVVACDVDESLLDETGKLCLDKAKLIVYSHGEYLALGKKLGTFGYTVRKKKPARKKK